MTLPFAPTREDGRSYRAVAIDALKDLDHGTLVSYRELGEILDLDPTEDLVKIQSTVRAANKDLLRSHKRGMKNVPKVGYRIIEANEHMIVAGSHQSKADRAMITALRFYNGADLSRMTEIERRLHHGQHMLAEAIYASHVQLNRRIQRIEDLLAGGTTVSNED
jgi:hypothetical protein